MDDDDDEVLTWYVWRHCQHLLTPIERRADRAGMVAIKADDAERRGCQSLARVLREPRDGEGDAEVRAALADGHEAFRRRVTRRLLSDAAVRAMIHRCPACGRIVRTPQARQCLWCKHAWRGRDA